MPISQALREGVARARKRPESANAPEELVKSANLDVSATTEALIRERVSQMPKTLRRTYLTAMGGHRPRLAVRAFCQMCMGWASGDTGRLGDAIRACSDPACPLHPYRPYQK